MGKQSKSTKKAISAKGGKTTNMGRRMAKRYCDAGDEGGLREEREGGRRRERERYYDTSIHSYCTHLVLVF